MTGATWGGPNGGTWGGEDGFTWGVGPPSEPDELEAEAASPTDIELSWNHVGTVSAARIYRAREQSDDLADYSQIAEVDAPTESYTDGDRVNGRTYHYRVTAVNAVGESDPSNPADATTNLPEPELAFDTSTEREIGISVGLEDDNSEGDVSLYRDAEEIATLSLDGLEYVDEDRLDGDEHDYHAVRDTGDTTTATDPEAVVVHLPDAAGLALDATVQSELTAEWGDVLNNGQYRLEKRDDDPDGDHPDWGDVATVDYDATLEETISDLVDGEQYSVRLRTETDYATGEWLTASPITLLVPASDVEITETSEFGATIEWSNESDFRGSNLIYRRRTDYEYDGPGRLVGCVAADDAEYTDESAAPDREYEYAVRALTQWVYADSDPATAETNSVGLSQRAVPSSEPYVEIDHPQRSAPLKPDVGSIQRQPTVNGYPRVSFDAPPDRKWLAEAFDDAPIRIWQDGTRQPISRLEHRTLSPDGCDFEARGGVQLDRRVVENVDIEEALVFAEYLIEEYTDYEAVVDDPEDVVREDVLLQLAETLAELQAAFEEIDDDVPLEWVDDALAALQTCWTEEAEIAEPSDTYEDDEFSGGEGEIREAVGDFNYTFSNDHVIPEGEGEIIVRCRRDAFVFSDIYFDGTLLGDGEEAVGGSILGWDSFEIPFDVEPGSHTIQIDQVGGDVDADETGLMLDVIGFEDTRFEHDRANEVHEPGGHLPGPTEYADVVHLLLEEIATPLSIVRAALEVTTDDGLGVAELSIGQDGTDDWDTVEEALEHSIDYDELAATLQARVGLGRKRDLEPRDETPRVGYEPQRLESLEMSVDMDETPVLVNYQPDKRLIDVLREVMDIADSVFAVLPGEDGTPEVHVSRIDGRETDADPDLIDWSVERNTEDTVDRAIVYAGAESIRRLPFEADTEEWSDLPLGDGMIVRDSETIYDAAADDDESLERDEDYELRPNNPDGSPEIQLLTAVEEPRLDCNFKPRGEHEAVDLPDEPSETIEHASNLASQQMADIAAFQAVEGSYTDAVIDVDIRVPTNQIGWDIIDALNVAALPGERAYQLDTETTDVTEGRFSLGGGSGASERIEELDDKTGQVSERV